MAQGSANSSQPTNMMVRRLADQGQNNQLMSGQNPGQGSGQGVGQASGYQGGQD
jgi:hypothetical protein